MREPGLRLRAVAGPVEDQAAFVPAPGGGVGVRSLEMVTSGAGAGVGVGVVGVVKRLGE